MKTMLAGVAFAALAAVPAFAQEFGIPVLESSSDVRVQDEVQSRLLGDRRLDHALLSVSVHDGHVSVVGSIRDESQEAEIYRVARQVSGARDVFVFAQPETE